MAEVPEPSARRGADDDGDPELSRALLALPPRMRPHFSSKEQADE